MEYFILGVVAFVVGTIYGWRLRERHLIRMSVQLANNLRKHMQEEDEKEQENLIHIVIEKHNDVLYVYDKKTMTFMAQATTKEKLEEELRIRFPGKRFACSEAILSELGLLS